MVAKKYLYHGTEYTITQLSKMCGHSSDFIRHRLNNGWSVEEAVDTPKEEEARIPEEYIGKVITVRFAEPIPSVFANMQPQRNKSYIARPANPANRSAAMGCKPYYTVTLESGKKLIVYPGEFEILGLAEEGGATSC